jgi:riboflavin synthase
MFTGIVEEIGVVENIEHQDRFSRLSIFAKQIFEGLKIGDSVCTNGVCLTVTQIKGACFEAEVMAQTLRTTALKTLVKGSKVNLERAALVGGRLGGHYVSGHIDEAGFLTRIERESEALWLTIQGSERFMKYVVDKGSVTINGVSLTIAMRSSQYFKVSLIPHTAGATVLGGAKVGDPVNLEYDLIGKYIEQMVATREGGSSCLNSAVLEAFLKG